MNVNAKLSLRDLIALTAMESALKTSEIERTRKDNVQTLCDYWSGKENQLAAFCYGVADRMLEHRGNVDWLTSETEEL